MSRKLTGLLSAMLVLAGAMSLKTVVMAHNDGATIMANGSAIPPADQRANGSAIPPADQRANGSAIPPADQRAR